MFEVFLILTALVVGLAVWAGYRRLRDPFMPAVVLGPMLLYMYVYSPVALAWGDSLERFFEPASLAYVQMVNLAFVAAFCIGLVPRVSAEMAARGPVGLSGSEVLVDGRTQRVLFRVASVLGWVALLVFIWLVFRAGGPVRVFSQAKVYVGHPIGYISELKMLSYPAIVLLAVAMQGRKLHVGHVVLALLFALPHLSVGLIGNRRGPAFLILLTLAASWYVARQKRPTLRTAMGGVVMLGLVMLLLVANRQATRAGEEVDADRFAGVLAMEDAQAGQEYIYAGGMILTATHTGDYYWGRRWIMQFVVRPFPSFLWPTKYEDLGFGGMVSDPGHAGYSEEQWRDGAGFVPPRGTAGGVAADLFREWSWLGLVFAFLIGRFYARLWERFAREGGMWTILYVLALALSVYLTAQSVGAWLYRIMLILIPTWLIWRRFIQPRVDTMNPWPHVDHTQPVQRPLQHSWLAGPPAPNQDELHRW